MSTASSTTHDAGLGGDPVDDVIPLLSHLVQLLATLDGGQRNGTDGQWRIAQRVAPDRVISTVDPDARHAHKTVHRRQDGFKAHIAVEPDTRDHHRLRADQGRRCG